VRVVHLTPRRRTLPQGHHQRAITAPGRLSLHSLRHGYASLLISRGLNVVFVSRQLGHANPNITLEVYAHLFERANHDTTARDALETSYAAMANGGSPAN
jgi:integrase